MALYVQYSISLKKIPLAMQFSTYITTLLEVMPHLLSKKCSKNFPFSSTCWKKRMCLETKGHIGYNFSFTPMEDS